MLQTAEALLIGFFAALLFAMGMLLLWVLNKVSDKLESIEKQISSIHLAFAESTNALNLVAQQTAVLRSLVVAFQRSLASMDQTTEAIRGLSGLLVAPSPPPPDEAPPLWTRGTPPLPNPLFDQYARAGDSGYIEQNDEDLAEIERQNLLREQGIETDPLRIPVPDPSAVNLINS